MDQSICILGRQPALGLAELESLFGTETVKPIGSQAALLDMPAAKVDFDRLGGIIRLANLLDTVDVSSWPEIEKYIIASLPKLLGDETKGKLRFGLSVFGIESTPSQLMASGLKIKKVIQSYGQSVRLIPNKELSLNAAQIIHNRLLNNGGCELIFIRDGNHTYIARTANVQDIADYTIRDRMRPKRDSRVGMLPPKLAQILINLAGTEIPHSIKNTSLPFDKTVNNKRLLDPFCGTGVVLQEAALIGYKVMGSDIEQRMVDYSEANLEWLKDKYKLPGVDYKLEAADATNYKWSDSINLIATETYLGRPFTSLPSQELIEQTSRECNLIIKKFLINVFDQLVPGTRLCLAVPAWSVGSGQFKHLPFIDQLSDLGYNRVSFKHVRNNQLIYYRENQFVARELLVLIRK
jgi:SAM-dependent methyltransferase